MEILVVGNYCHDTLIKPEGTFELLGGSASYISFALAPTEAKFKMISKVGKDFLYHSALKQPPIISKTHPTAHFRDRVFPDQKSSQLTALGEAITAEDIRNTISRSGGSKSEKRIGLVCGVAMEILPETILELRKHVDVLICDIQGLIRTVDKNQTVHLAPFSQTPFANLLDEIDLLKMNIKEAKMMDLQRPKNKAWIITRGDQGTTLVQDDGEITVAPIPVKEIDATGAGDCFIAGLALGLSRGMGLTGAIELGSQYGAFAVQTLGIPDFSKFTQSPA